METEESSEFPLSDVSLALIMIAVVGLILLAMKIATHLRKLYDKFREGEEPWKDNQPPEKRSYW